MYTATENEKHRCLNLANNKSALKRNREKAEEDAKVNMCAMNESKKNVWSV